MFGAFSITWWPGAIIFQAIGLVLIVRWFRYTKGRQRATNYGELFGHFRAFFSQGSALSNKRLFLCALVAGLCSMASVAVGDVQANRPCVEACEREGWSDGRLRGNPHDDAKQFERACWCLRGGQWSPTSVDY